MKRLFNLSAKECYYNHYAVQLQGEMKQILFLKGHIYGTKWLQCLMIS